MTHTKVVAMFQVCPHRNEVHWQYTIGQGVVHMGWTEPTLGPLDLNSIIADFIRDELGLDPGDATVAQMATVVIDIEL